MKSVDRWMGRVGWRQFVVQVLFVIGAGGGVLLMALLGARDY
ncbi:hypothetical protein [Streptomyces sp. NPDC056069]